MTNTATKTYYNTDFVSRDHEATNVVACQTAATMPSVWVECDESVLSGLTQLWTEDGRTYFGWL